jgi:hypothetical protein
MIKPICSKCNKELQNFGAILLSPPDNNNFIIKKHICRECYFCPKKKIRLKDLGVELPKKIEDKDMPEHETKHLFDLYKNGYNQAIDDIGKVEI